MEINKIKWFGIGFLILILLTPLGLLAPGTAFGEWSSTELKEMLNYVPVGIEKGEALWNALFKDYTMPGLSEGFFQLSVGYIVSAFIGSVVIFLVVLILVKYVIKKGSEDEPT